MPFLFQKCWEMQWENTSAVNWQKKREQKSGKFTFTCARLWNKQGAERAPKPWDEYSQEGDGPDGRYVVVSGREQCLGLKGRSKAMQAETFEHGWKAYLDYACFIFLPLSCCSGAFKEDNTVFLVWLCVSSSLTHYLHPQKNQPLSERFIGNRLSGHLQAHYPPCRFLHL